MRPQSMFLIVSFCGLVCCALTIALRKPMISFCSFQEPDQLLICNWHSRESLRLDLSTGFLRKSQSKKHETVWQFPDAKVRLAHGGISPRTSEQKWEDYEATVIDNDRVEKRFVFNFPQQPSSIEFLDSSTVVCTSNEMLYAVNLGQPSQVGTFHFAQEATLSTTILNSKRIVVHCYNAPAPPDKNILLDVSDLQNITTIASWPMGIGLTVGKDCLYEANLNRSAIVRRSLVDGSELGNLMLTPAVQAVFDPKQGHTIEVAGNLIVIDQLGKHFYFDLDSQEPLELERFDLFPARGEFQQLPIRLFYSQPNTWDMELVAYDSASHRVVWEQGVSRDFTTYEVYPPDKLILGTDQFALWIDVVDVRTGEVLRSFTPFRYLSWLMLFTEIGFAAWIVIWLNSSTSKSIPVWLNISLLSAIAVILFCSFHIGLNWWPDDRSVPQSYCQGVFLGLSTSSLAWLAFGRTSIGTRYLPMMTILFLTVLFAGYVTPAKPYFKSGMVSVVLLHVAAASVVYGGLRLLGLRFESLNSDTRTHAPLTLRALFVLAGVVAIMMTVTRPVFQFGLPDMDFARVMGLIAFAIGATCMLAVFSKHSVLFSGACVLVAIIYATMIFESLFQFVTARPVFVDHNHLIWHWFRISTAGLTTSFLVNLAYRNRACRLARTVKS